LFTSDSLVALSELDILEHKSRDCGIKFLVNNIACIVIFLTSKSALKEGTMSSNVQEDATSWPATHLALEMSVENNANGPEISVMQGYTKPGAY
jgi:hypothetical protein